MLPGTPIFNDEWILQGVTLMSEGRKHKCVRVDAILLALSKISNWHIQKMLEGLHRAFKENVLKKVLYYIIWGG